MNADSTPPPVPFAPDCTLLPPSNGQLPLSETKNEGEEKDLREPKAHLQIDDFYANPGQIARSSAKTLIDETLKTLISGSAPRVELARLCRQICLTREGEPSGTSSLDEELTTALNTVKGVPGGEALTEDDLVEIFEVEQNRVANAAVLADLLAPRLALQLQRRLSPAALTPTQGRPSFTSSPPAPKPVENDRPKGPPGIADLIDGMLDQERRSATPPRRPNGR